MKINSIATLINLVVLILNFSKFFILVSLLLSLLSDLFFVFYNVSLETNFGIISSSILNLTYFPIILSFAFSSISIDTYIYKMLKLIVKSLRL